MRLFKIFTLIKQSFKSETYDFTQGSIRKAVFLLAIPMILELSLESVFAVVDIFFVSGLGDKAVVTVGLTEAMITIVYSLGIGISTAATAIIARRFGEKNTQECGNVIFQSVFLVVVIGVLLSMIGMFYPKNVLRIMGANSEVVEYGYQFTRIMFLSSFSIMLLFLFNGIFRGAGIASVAMKSLWLASGINIILCPIFIKIFGVNGAAIATTTGRSIGVLYQIYFFIKFKTLFNLSRHSIKIKIDELKNLINISWPATFQFILMSGSWIVMAKFVSETGGNYASAGYQIAIRNIVFFILPAWGLSNVAATLVGQNLGAQNAQRAEDSVKYILKITTVFMLSIVVFFYFFGNPLMRVFSNTPEIIHFSTLALQTISLGYLVYGIGMVITQALNGAGDTKSASIAYFITFWLCQIPLAYYLAYHTSLKTHGVFIAIPASEALLAIIIFWVFKRGKWKNIKL